MEKEYKLTIHAIGKDRETAIESAITMLNLGSTFDEVLCVDGLSELMPLNQEPFPTEPRH